ncbi:MAG: hypothetical protein WCB27_18380 [Thermoguttaceae bacterium]
MRPIRIHLLAALFCFAVSSQALVAGGWESTALDKLFGEPADIAPYAYQFRANRPATENPPESSFLFSALGHVKAETLCGLLWEEPRPVKQVVLEWPVAAASIPKPDRISLRWFPEDHSASWWCRSGEGVKLHQSKPPSVSADGRRYTYTLDALSNEAALDNLVVAVKGGSKSPDAFDVPTVRVLAPETWDSLKVIVEWGFQEGTQQKDFSGSIEAYNGIVGKVAPLADDQTTRQTGVNAWQSRGGKSRRGVGFQLLYIGYHDTPVWPGQAKIEDVNRTIVTVRTKSGSFSFLPADLEKGPILAPEYGFFVEKTSDFLTITADGFRKELQAKGLKTLRQQIHARPEQSWANVMRAVHPEFQGKYPLFPQQTVSSPMTVEVPEPQLTAAWKIGATNMLRDQKKDARGKWRFRDPPYDALALETHMYLRVLDWMGLHREARDGYEMWLDRCEKPVPLPDGLWTGGPAHFFSGIDWDGAHGGGVSMIHLAMLEHYRLTRDKQWLASNAAKLNANAEWMIQQRKQYSAAIPGHEKLWADGLLPPHNTWDNRIWRSWYRSNASFCRALQEHAEVIAQVDPEAGRRFAREAEDYRKALLAAVEKSLTLSPVIRVRDGTYHSFLPTAPYIRGTASRFLPAYFGAEVYGMPMHTPGLYADVVLGGEELPFFGLLPLSDPRIQGLIDVLEDRLLSENFKIYLAFKDYDPQRDWFSRSGWYYQCGHERTAYLHLLGDDPACFLRTWLNQYAIVVLPGSNWHFREHTAAQECYDKTFEEAVFLDRFRKMLVSEDGDVLRLAQATPRAWLEQGKKICVKNAPTDFGTVAYEIVSDADHGKVAATVQMPARNPPKTVLLRLRHPQGLPMKSVTVNGNDWTDFDPAKEVISLHGVTGTVAVQSQY